MTYFSAFPCLLGLTILLLQTIFVSKKSNEKWKAQNKFAQFVQFVVKKANLLPSFQGGAGGRLFPLTKREAWLTLFHIGVLCDARFALTKIIPQKKCEQKGCYPQINL